MRTLRYALFAAAALAVTAACSDGVTSPGAQAATGSAFFTAIDTTTEPDSVIGGYGCEPTGGYKCFEYEPCTGTEYVVTPDTICEKRGMQSTESNLLFGPTVSTDTTPTPPPAPAPKPSPIVPQDSVIGGYGSGSTGGLEYQDFEYDPETGTETVVTPDTTPDPTIDH